MSAVLDHSFFSAYREARSPHQYMAGAIICTLLSTASKWAFMWAELQRSHEEYHSTLQWLSRCTSIELKPTLNFRAVYSCWETWAPGGFLGQNPCEQPKLPWDTNPRPRSSIVNFWCRSWRKLVLRSLTAVNGLSDVIWHLLCIVSIVFNIHNTRCLSSAAAIQF